MKIGPAGWHSNPWELKTDGNRSWQRRLLLIVVRGPRSVAVGGLFFADRDRDILVQPAVKVDAAAVIAAKRHRPAMF
jgi:hypothetical protein